MTLAGNTLRFVIANFSDIPMPLDYDDGWTGGDESDESSPPSKQKQRSTSGRQINLMII